jgi:hypothetical protein
MTGMKGASVIARRLLRFRAAKKEMELACQIELARAGAERTRTS